MASGKEKTRRLREGTAFHKEVQDEWISDGESGLSQDGIEREKHVTKPGGRRGRIDIYIGDRQGLVGVVELKASDWDSMTPEAVRRNVRRQVKQIWDYIESQLTLDKDVSPGVIFPRRPKDSARVKVIESLFEDQGISVVWRDETTQERKKRG